MCLCSRAPHFVGNVPVSSAIYFERSLRIVSLFCTCWTVFSRPVEIYLSCRLPLIWGMFVAMCVFSCVELELLSFQNLHFCMSTPFLLTARWSVFRCLRRGRLCRGSSSSWSRVITQFLWFTVYCEALTWENASHCRSIVFLCSLGLFPRPVSCSIQVL